MHWLCCILNSNDCYNTSEVQINFDFTWWRHQMEIFPALLNICAGNSPVTGEFPAQRPVTWSFDFFYMRLNERLTILRLVILDVHYDVTVMKFRCPFSEYTLYLPALSGSSIISSPGHVTRNHDDMMMSSHGKSFRITARYIFFVVSSSDVIVMYHKKRENLCWATLTATLVHDLGLY